MKRITIIIAALALICSQAQAQSFLDKIKQKAESAIGGSLGDAVQGMIPEGISQMAGQADNDDPNSVKAVTGEQALPAKRASTFGWDGPVTPSSAKFPIPLMNEFPAVPSAQELINPVEANQIAYYKAIKAVTLRAEELNMDATCEDTETLMWRQKANDGLKSAFGLTDAEVAILTDDNASEADKQRVSEKIEKSILGDLDVSALEADAARYENMSEADAVKMMSEKSLEATFQVYDRNASDIRKYMGLEVSELKAAAREQMTSPNYMEASPKMQACNKKMEAYQKAQSAKDPSFKKEADAFQKRFMEEQKLAQQKSSRSMMGGMGSAMDMMEKMNQKTAGLNDMQVKMSKYLQDIQACYDLKDATADVNFAASERKKLIEIKNKIYQTEDPSVYNPLYAQALERIMSYRERAAEVWVEDVQKRFNARKESLGKIIKINRQAIEDGLIPECALYREPLNVVIQAGDVLAEAYSEFPSDYPKMYKEEIVREINVSAAKVGCKRIHPWWPEFAVFGQADFDAIGAGKHIYSTAEDGKVYHFSGGSWSPVSDEELQKLNDKRKDASSPKSASWTSSDGKRKVFYNAEGGFLQMPEGDQVFPTAWKKTGNKLQWYHEAIEDTGNGNYKYQLVLCTYML